MSGRSEQARDILTLDTGHLGGLRAENATIGHAVAVVRSSCQSDGLPDGTDDRGLGDVIKC